MAAGRRAWRRWLEWRAARPFPFIHDDDVAGRERRRQELFDIGQEACAVDRPIEDEGRIDPIATERGQEGQRSPTALRCHGHELAPARRPAP